MKSLSTAIMIFRFITGHPLNKGRELFALRRFLKWQLGSRLVPGAIAVNFVNSSRLLVKPGMTGATGNVYTGLHEFEDMAFLLHAIRKGDLFVDVGANIGSYTILAGAAVGASCIAFEPVPSTYSSLMDNININGIFSNAKAINVGLGKENGELRFTSQLDTVNHVINDNDGATPSITVPVKTLDSVIGSLEPRIIKIDVEGFETNVVSGAVNTLSQSTLLAVIMELNGSGSRYGFDEAALHERMLGFGFQTFTYRPFQRELVPLNGKNLAAGNTLYVRDPDQVRERLAAAPAFSTNGRSV